MTPHRQLLADYADSGSEEAFRQLVTAYIGFVHGSALRLVNGNSQLAEDIAQTVFTDLARKAKTLSPDVMVGGWLHRRTCHAALTLMRGERRRLVRETEAVEMNALNSEDPDGALAAVAPILDEAINQLDEMDREAIVRRFFERSNLRAVGEAMGTTEAAAQKRVQRALEKLRGLLARRGVVLPMAGLALAVGAASASAAPAGLAATVSTGALAGAHAGSGFTLTTLKFMAMTKLKVTVIAAAVAVLAVGTVTTTVVVLNRDPSYTPPLHPDPQKIMYEASADTGAGRYKEAEAKFIWYRDNALRYNPSLVGVRDSFALMYWCQLAEKYPPARRKLVAIRDAAVKTVRSKSGGEKSIRLSFITALSINQGLKEESKSIELFKWLDTNDKTVAGEVYPVMEAPLINAGEYALCGHYLDPDGSYQRILQMYNMTAANAKHSANPQLRNFADRKFSNDCASLVAVLEIDNRQDDADRIARKAADVVKTPEFGALMADAKLGKVPPKWP